jgi:microcystin-dependent protein
MGTPFLGELRTVSFNFAPKGWALCNGQLLAINQNQALFALLGTYYGGDGRVSFALPNLQGSSALHMSSGFPIGASGGEALHTLTVNELPSHTHTVSVGTATAKAVSPAGATWAATTNGLDLYSTAAPNTAMSGSSVAVAFGAGTGHENRPPYLVLNVIIALVGIFPSRN